MRTRLRSLATGVLVVLLALGSIAQPAAAQNAAAIVATTSSPAPSSAQTSGPHERQILTDILKDQRDIWTSPLRLDKGDTRSSGVS